MKEHPMTHLPGKFVWFEHSSSNLAKARKFYDPLFDWHTEAMPMGEQRYHMIFNGADSIGGYRSAADGQRSCWIAYLSVDDVDTSFAAAIAAGAKALERPADHGDVGRGARIADPAGAILSLWKSTRGDRPDPVKTPSGDWYWNELWTSDEIGALAFYQRVFGYSHDTMDMGAQGTYYIFTKGGVSRAGMMRSADPRAPSMWLPYVAVDDCDATVDKARRLGGEVLTAPTEVPGVGRYAMLADPLGAAIAVIRPAPAVNAAAEAAMQEATAA
jgi:predicted enzyme related to lactoylglutathione lyase